MKYTRPSAGVSKQSKNWRVQSCMYCLWLLQPKCCEANVRKRNHAGSLTGRCPSARRRRSFQTPPRTSGPGQARRRQTRTEQSEQADNCQGNILTKPASTMTHAQLDQPETTLTAYKSEAGERSVTRASANTAHGTEPRSHQKRQHEQVKVRFARKSVRLQESSQQRELPHALL